MNTKIGQKTLPRPLRKRVTQSKYKDRFHFKFSKKLFLTILSIILVFTVYGYYYSYSKVKSYHETILGNITNISPVCDKYSNEDKLNSLLFINLNSSRKINKVQYLIYNTKTQLSLDFTNTEFNIDKSNTKGNLNDYFQKSSLYLDDNNIYKSFFNLFLRQFSLNIDYLFISNTDSTLSQYLETVSSSFLNKVIKPTSEAKSEQKIVTNMCIKDMGKFASDYLNVERGSASLPFNSKKKLEDLLDMDEIKKEQVRIYIKNFTGVEGWGRLFENVLNNYGIHVVKIDDSPTTEKKTNIFFENKDLKTSHTWTQIKTLFPDTSGEETTVKENIFADIYIELGQDSLQRF